MRSKEFKPAATSSNLVFAGQLIRKKQLLLQGVSPQDSVYSYVFVPTKIWRGTGQADSIVITSGRTNCGISLLPGGSYVVYTTAGQDLGICNRIVGHSIEIETARLDKFFQKPRFRRLLATPLPFPDLQK